ncbi:MAG: opacity protein-like surface antigen [Planctomycetota bacterium]|jgi:opacity protein-like surface antigen
MERLRVSQASLLALMLSACATTSVSPSVAPLHSSSAAYSALPVYQDMGMGGQDRKTFEIMLGSREMSDGDWDVSDGSDNWDLSTHSVFGIGSSRAPADGSISPEWSLLIAQGSDSDNVGAVKVDLDATSIEFGFGARKTFNIDGSPIAPYIGAGIGLVTTVIEASGSAGGQSASIAESDSALGVYFHGGANFWVGDSFSLGLDYRVLTGAGYVDALDGLDADYSQFMFVLGFAN